MMMEMTASEPGPSDNSFLTISDHHAVSTIKYDEGTDVPNELGCIINLFDVMQRSHSCCKLSKP